MWQQIAWLCLCGEILLPMDGWIIKQSVSGSCNLKHSSSPASLCNSSPISFPPKLDWRSRVWLLSHCVCAGACGFAHDCWCLCVLDDIFFHSFFFFFYFLLERGKLCLNYQTLNPMFSLFLFHLTIPNVWHYRISICLNWFSDFCSPISPFWFLLNLFPLPLGVPAR